MCASAKGERIDSVQPAITAMEIDAFTEYGAVQDYLFSLKARGVKFGIDRMRAWSGAIGHPEDATPCIHLAGTNGKGSTSAILESIFREAGWLEIS